MAPLHLLVKHFSDGTLAADNLWTIGTIRVPGQLRAVSARTRNVPMNPVGWWRGDRGRYDTWYFE